MVYDYGGSLSGFAFNGTYMYFPDNQYIMRVNLDGSIDNSTWAECRNPQCCAIYNDYLYVSNANTISKISLNDPTDNNQNWLTMTDTIDGIFNPLCLAINGHYLYISNAGNNTISKINLNDASDNNFEWASSLQGIGIIFSMIIHGDYLYFTNYKNPKVGRISLTNPLSDYNSNWYVEDYVGVNRDAFSLAVDTNYIYLTYTANNLIRKISLTNSTDNFIWATSANGLDNPIFITINGDYLYVYNAVPGSENNHISKINISNPLLNVIWSPPPPPPPLPCFKECTKILTDKGYIEIQNLIKGDFVKTLLNGYQPINMIGKKEIMNKVTNEITNNQLYKYTNEAYPEVFEDLVMTGCHSILVDDFVTDEQREKVKEVLGDIYITNNKYRLPACADNRASLYETPGKHTIYHLALDNENYYSNYGIYANGLLVETCSKRFLKELSNMELIE